MSFFPEHVGKQEPVGYEDRIKLLSLSKQVKIPVLKSKIK